MTQFNGVSNKINANTVIVPGNTFSGILSHANTADRTYTFPNNTGTVALLADVNKTGFPNRTSTTLTWNTGTRTVTLAPTGSNFTVSVNGIQYTKTTQTSTVPNVTGGYFIYFDNTGTLQQSTTPWDLSSTAPIAYVYWDSGLADGFAFEERHLDIMDPSTHEYLHNINGTEILSGFTASGYDLAGAGGNATNAFNTFALASGVVADEDIKYTTSALADGGPYTIFNRTGATGTWTWTKTNTIPFRVGTTYPQYNQWTGATWQMTEGASLRYINYFVFATTALDPLFQYIIIPGQNIFTSLAGAQTETYANLQLGTLPFQELAPLYQITLRTGAGVAYNGATGSCRIEAVSRIAGSKTSISQASIVNHEALGGLLGGDAVDGHFHLNLAQYNVLATVSGGITATTGTFSDATDATLDTNSSGSLYTVGGLSVTKTLQVASGSSVARLALGTYGSLGQVYNSAATIIGNNIYVDTADTVSNQVRYRRTHASYGHTYLQMVGGAFSFFGASASVTQGNVVTPITLATLTPTTGLTTTGSATHSATTDASVGAELITTVADRDFSSDSGNWTGTGWTIGAGVYTHVAGANAATLAGLAAGVGGVYQIVVGINTTTAGSFTISFGGATSFAFGQAVGAVAAMTFQLTAINTAGLVITPDATWAGTIDNVSVKQITIATSSLNLKSAAGSIGIEARTYGAISFGIGNGALRSGNVASHTIALGYQAGYANQAGNNTAIGSQAMLSNVSSIGHTALGYAALSRHLSGTGNTALGAYALLNQVSGVNTAIGYQSGYSNLVGSGNTAIGYVSQYSNLVGANNTSIGERSLYFNTASNNTAVGYYASYNNTTGAQNVAVGREALYTNTTGIYNVGLGYRANYTNTTGSYNIAVGGIALNGNTTGTGNIAIGYAALTLVRPTSKAITAFADYSATVAGTVKATSVAHGLTGTTSKIITGTTNYNGTFNVTVIDADNFYFTDTWLGNDATGWWSAANEGTNNVAFGYNAGVGLTTGYDNTFIGHQAGQGITTGIGNTILGRYITSLSAGLTNNIILASGNTNRMSFDGTDWSIPSTTASTSSTTGSLKLAGGLGVAGDIYSGGSVISLLSPTSNAFLILSGAIGFDAGIYFKSNNVVRTTMQTQTNGDIFSISAYTTGGVWIDNWLSVATAAGGTVTLARPTSITNTTASTTTATGALKVSGGLGVVGQVNADSFVPWGSSTVTGSISRHASAGLKIQGIVGSTYDFAILKPDNSAYIMGVPTGTDTLKIVSTTASSSYSTGALTVAGGLGVAGAGFFGGRLSAASSDFAGGIGIGPGQAANASAGIWMSGGLTSVSTAQYGIVYTMIPSTSATTYTAGYFQTAVPDTGALSNAYAIRVLDINKAGSGTVTNNYGIYINALTGGSSTNYALYANAGITYFGDTTASTSSTTGSVRLAGGLGVAGAGYFGSHLVLDTNFSYLKGKTTGAATVNLFTLTSDTNNITRFIAGVDAGGFQWTDQGQTTAWATLQNALFAVNGVLRSNSNFTANYSGNAAGNITVGTSGGSQQNYVKIYGGVSTNQSPVLSLFRTGNTEGGLAISSSKIKLFQSTGLANYNDTTIDAATGLTIDTAGAGIFSSSVTATSFVKTSGTSAQFLKADGSVDSNTYSTTAHNHTGVYQPLATNLTTIGALANAAGVLTNNGSGGFSYVAAGTGTVTSVDTAAANQGLTASWTNTTTTPRLTLGFTDLQFPSESYGLRSNYGTFCETYSERACVVGSNIYRDPADTVSQVRTRNSHATYGHAMLWMSGGQVSIYAKSESVTANAVVNRNLLATFADPGITAYKNITISKTDARLNLNSSWVGSDAGVGLKLFGSTGSSYDVAFLNAAGTVWTLRNPTGTNVWDFSNTPTVAGTAVALSGGNISQFTNNSGYLTSLGLVRNTLTPGVSLDSSLTASTFRTKVFGSSTSGYQLSTCRWDTSLPTILSGLSSYGTMLAWAGSDTHGFLALNYATQGAIIGGGNADLINWTATLITSANIGSTGLAIGGTTGTFSSNITTGARLSSTVDNLHLDPNSGANSVYLNYYQGTGGTRFCNGANTVVATVDSAGLITGANLKTNNYLYCDNQYGSGIIGAYDYTKYRMIYAMGSSYTSLANGTGLSNHYGIGYAYEGYWGIPSGLGHCATFANAGSVQTAIGSSIWTSGQIRAGGDITAFYSDIRLKENITPIQDPIGIIKRLSGNTFNSNELAASFGFIDKKRQLGVIAQEVQAVLPELVTQAPFDADNKTGENYLTVKYEKFAPLFIEAFKAQQEQIESQQEEINSLKAAVAKLVALLEA